MYKNMTDTKFWIHVALCMFDNGYREETKNLDDVQWFWKGIDHAVVKKDNSQV